MGFPVVTKLEAAVANGDDRALEGIIKEFGGLDVKNDYGETALVVSCLGGKVGVARELLRLGAGVMVQDAIGNTALHVAVLTGNSKLVEVFLLHNVLDINARNDYGSTPLHYAMTLPAPYVASLLLDQHADASLTDNQGSTALHLAASLGKQDTVRLLLEAGSDPNTPNSQNKTAKSLSWGETAQLFT
eukprot:TRINITY_DN22908_c0_g1_i1.p1 TRINITY_DN22908_c0_g1~~TRINITY_DN22908_c0_g1_i1.p1  ORF type:complete len:207 (+),score=47.22 TRINITY_DN22908_c0_g1_i1:60-623(+)